VNQVDNISKAPSYVAPAS